MVSIIIPCYNQGGYLADALNSLLAQSWPNWECIIVDDGSTDNSSIIANQFVQQDSRFRYLYKTNGGLPAARNTGIENASGQWIQLLDGDDIIEPGKLQIQLTLAEKKGMNDHAVLITDYRYGSDQNIYQEVPGYIRASFITTNYLEELIINWEQNLVIPPHCFLFSGDFFNKHGIRFDETLPNHEDFDCWLSIFAMRPRVLYTDQVLCRYRRSNHSMSSNMKRMGEGFIQVINKHINLPVYSSSEHLLLKQKRLDILKRYIRIDLMGTKEKLESWKFLLKYYSSRLVHKLAHRRA